LQNEAAVVPCEVDRALKDLSWWPILLGAVAIEPVFDRDLLNFLSFFVGITGVASGTLGEKVVLVDADCLGLA